MRTHARLAAVALCIWVFVVVAFEPVTAAAQGRDWKAAQVITPRAVVRVERYAGEIVEGRLTTATEDSVSVETKTAVIEIQRADVREICVRIRKTKGRPVLTGFIAGASLGLVQGVTLVKTNRAPWSTMFMSIWGGVGSLIGLSNREHEDVYTVVFTTS
jgi:hypothetical protein